MEKGVGEAVLSPRGLIHGFGGRHLTGICQTILGCSGLRLDARSLQLTHLVGILIKTAFTKALRGCLVV